MQLEWPYAMLIKKRHQCTGDVSQLCDREEYRRVRISSWLWSDQFAGAEKVRQAIDECNDRPPAAARNQSTKSKVSTGLETGRNQSPPQAAEVGVIEPDYRTRLSTSITETNSRPKLPVGAARQAAGERPDLRHRTRPEINEPG